MTLLLGLLWPAASKTGPMAPLLVSMAFRHPFPLTMGWTCDSHQVEYGRVTDAMSMMRLAYV